MAEVVIDFLRVGNFYDWILSGEWECFYMECSIVTGVVLLLSDFEPDYEKEGILRKREIGGIVEKFWIFENVGWLSLTVMLW